MSPERKPWRLSLNSIMQMDFGMAAFLGSVLIAATTWTTITTVTLSSHEKILNDHGSQLAVIIKNQTHEEAKLNAILNTVNGVSKLERSVANVP